MTSLQPYSIYQIKEIQDKNINTRMEWRNLEEERHEEDLLEFMETFKFPSLDSLKNSLKASGEYTENQIDEIIYGLKNLPEYRD